MNQPTNQSINRSVSQSVSQSRKPCCRKETERRRSCSFRFKVHRKHSLQV